MFPQPSKQGSIDNYHMSEARTQLLPWNGLDGAQSSLGKHKPKLLVWSFPQSGHLPMLFTTDICNNSFPCVFSLAPKDKSI